MLMRHLRAVVIVGAVVGLAARGSAQNNDLTRCTIVDGGAAVARVQGGTLLLGNAVIAGDWQIQGPVMWPVTMTDKIARRPIPVGNELFTLVLSDGTEMKASQLKVVAGSIAIEEHDGQPGASRLADRLAGRVIAVSFAGPNGSTIAWRGILRNGANYLRQQVRIQAAEADVNIKQLILIDALMPGATVSGTAQGSPVVADHVFAGVEHPMSQCLVQNQRARCVLSRDVPVRAGQTFTISSVVGVAPEGQMRRAFLQYLERERAHPYRTFLHYNTWYDIGYFPVTKYDEKGALEVVTTYGEELNVRRGVKLDSFLFDDGWDNPESLWDFHAGFPQGFARVKEAAAKYGAAPGVWMSPWGGYNEPKKVRLAFGQKQGYETNKGGFALSGPVYYKRFHDVTTNMVRQYGANMFKFDGVGRALGTVPGSRFGSDFEAAIQLIDDLRVEKPDIFINLTTGTWPSPFWLQYADSIWRGGSDHDFIKQEIGSRRQRWITYRDADTYKGIVQKGPLYPLSSLMLHGLIYAKSAKGLDTDPQDDFTAEVHDYFGTGTDLQEMYITPSLLSQKNWDVLADAAKWSRANADVLFDTHWVGGDPAKFEVYGWASWTPAKGILVLRNPGDQPAKFTLDIAKAFELPAKAVHRYRAHSPWAADRALPTVVLTAGEPHTFELKPFEVLTLDAVPVGVK
jgi:hypothetical protein